MFYQRRYHPNTTTGQNTLDLWLVLPMILLMSLGLIMVQSASMYQSLQHGVNPLYFFKHQCIHCILALSLFVGLQKITPKTIQQLGAPIIGGYIILLLLSHIPGIMHRVNGSARWLYLGPIHIQLSEWAKLATVLFMSHYLTKFPPCNHWQQVIRPLLPIGLVALLLLLQPDYGTAVLIMMITLLLQFIAGTRLRYLLGLALVALVLFALLALTAPYRLKRLMAFSNPWANPYGSSYQLTQSLIAFGRGGLVGVGLGNSMQKLFYLPEAHTDFIFSIFAEECGLLGVITMIVLYLSLIGRMLYLGWQKLQQHDCFEAYLILGIGCCLSLQVLINMGVTMALLPTKGFTLPFISYGGTSMLLQTIMVGLVHRARH
jgi:cell division protein FtsW